MMPLTVCRVYLVVVNRSLVSVLEHDLRSALLQIAESAGGEGEGASSRFVPQTSEHGFDPIM
jgi:hypothetical protein